VGGPATNADTFRLMAEADILPSYLTTKLQRMAQFRKRIVHLYWEVDLDQVCAILQGHLDDVDRYLDHIELHLSKAEL
jgi:uncharacterized protein YutE (UPF0331/DUF86 family)